MKEEKEEQADIEEFIEQKTLFKDHSEPFCYKWNRIRIAAIVKMPADNCDLTSQTAYCCCYFLNALVETDAVGDGKDDFRFTRFCWHVAKIVKLSCKLCPSKL
jgi:hypothetical protein